MTSNGKKAVPGDLKLYYGTNKKISLLVFWFSFSGILASVLWLGLFVAGLLVDSAYYRTAISYGFATLNDWILAAATFTFSNVILLAFMSGLLGGITSKMLYTRGFRISISEYKEANPYQIENPFISAFRGMFVFVAILFMQYVSSFSDLSAINNLPKEQKIQMTLNYEKIYSKLVEAEKDTMITNIVKKEFERIKSEESENGTDTSVLNNIFRLKEDLHDLKINGKGKASVIEKRAAESKIRWLRRTLKGPSNSDFSGIGLSSFSYFRFAVIVSFLAFAFGYDPSLFADFFQKIFKRFNGNSASGSS
jgi:hypothetical protein